jgi:prevent-host-death family protein
MIVNIHAAKTQLSKLLERAEAGEEVVIARAGKPVARLVALASTPDADGPDPAPFGLGSLRGQIWISPDVEGDWWREMMRRMEDNPIFPPGDEHG